jgi:hypothetical protein
MKYTFTFPSFPMGPSATVTVIKTIRQLCPGLGLKEAKEMIENGGTQVLAINGSVGINPALAILRDHGVVASEVTDGEYGDYYDYDYSYDQDYSETPEWRQMETDTVGDLRTVAIAALDRGEYDIAIALIQMIRDFK